MKCSKCEEPSAQAIMVLKGDPPADPKEKDIRGMQIIRFCEGHWAEVEELLPQ